MIDILNIKNVSVHQVVDMLLDENSTSFEISVPKYAQLAFSEPEAILRDYAHLAYSGQILKDCSIEFSYDKVPPEFHESVLFVVATNNLELLAKGLLNISYGYDNEHEDEEFIFSEEVEEYIDKIEKGVTDPACPYFMEVFLRLRAEID